MCSTVGVGPHVEYRQLAGPQLGPEAADDRNGT